MKKSVYSGRCDLHPRARIGIFYVICLFFIFSKQKKEKGIPLHYFFQAFQKKNAAIITKTKPVMPLTSLDDNNMLAESKVDNMASPNKIAANIITSKPKIKYSAFMMSYFRRYHLIILWMDHVEPFPFCEHKFSVICLVAALMQQM